MALIGISGHHSKADHDRIEFKLNTRPRKRLDPERPFEV